MIEYFTVDDPIGNTANDCVEVTVKLKGHRKRWCFFVTSEWIDNYLCNKKSFKPIDHNGFVINQMTLLGRSLNIQGEPFEIIAVPHMIIVKEINEQVIETTLNSLDENNELLRSTKLL